MRNRLINIIPLQERTWELSFDVVLLESTTESRNILHFTTGENKKNKGDRTPAIFTNRNQILFRINIDDPQRDAYHYDHVIPLNKKVNVKIQQVLDMTSATKATVRIFIDRNQVHELSHHWQIPFENVKCYYGNPWYNPSPVRISNLRYTQQMLYPGT